MSITAERLTPFSETWERECIEGSAIAPGLVAIATEVLDAEPIDPYSHEPLGYPIHEALGWGDPSRFWQTRRPHRFGAGAFLRQESGEVWQIKPETPRPDPRKPGQLIKYETPMGAGSRAYLPPIDRWTLRRICQRHRAAIAGKRKLSLSEVYRVARDAIAAAGGFWNWVRANPSIPVVITEGGKKTLALLSQGYVAIGLTGVNGGHGRVGEDERPMGRNGLRKGEDTRPVALTADVAAFAVKGRKITVAFDQDDRAKTRRRVMGATQGLAKLLIEAGATVAIASWDKSLGKGIDDVAAAHGPAAVELILGSAIAPNVAYLPQTKAERRDRTLARARAIRAAARDIAWDLETNGRYIPPLAQTPAEHGGRDLDAAMGTGKTIAIARDIAPQMFTIVLAPRNALGKQTAARCDFPHIHDYQPSQGEILALDAISRGGIVACAQSIDRVLAVLKALGNPPYQVVIDEPTEVFGEILGGQTIKNRYSPIVAGVFALLRGAQSVDIAQADLDAPTVDLVADVTGRSRYRHRHNSPDNPPWDVTLWNGPVSGWRAALLTAIKSGQRIHLATTSKDEGQRLALFCENLGIPYLKVDGDTDPQAIAEFCENPDGAIARERPQVLITSPTISSGSSIEIKGYFDAVFVYGPALDPAVPAQMAGRIRESIPRHFWLPAFIKPERWEKPGHNDGQRARARVLTHWGDDGRDRGNDQRIINSYLDRRRALAWARKVAPHEAITEILEAQGHRVTAIACDSDKATAKIWAECRETLARRRAKERAAAQPSDRQNLEWAKRLDNRESTYQQRVIAEKVRAGDALPGMDWDDPETWYQVHFKPRESGQRAAKAIAWVDCEPEPLAYRMGGERQWVTGELSQPLIAPHLLPTRSRELAIMALFKPHIAALLERGEARPGDPEVAAIAATARPMADEIRAVMDLTIDSNTSDMAIARKLFRRFGIDTERKSYLRGADGGRSWTLKLTTGEYWDAVAEARRRYWDAVILSAQGIQQDPPVVTVSPEEGDQENCNHLTEPEQRTQELETIASLTGQEAWLWVAATQVWTDGRVLEDHGPLVLVFKRVTGEREWLPREYVEPMIAIA